MSPEKLTNPFSSLTVEQGLVRNIGVSNWNCQGLRDLVSYAKIKPAVLQVHAQLKMPSTRVHMELISKLSGKEGHGMFLTIVRSQQVAIQTRLRGGRHPSLQPFFVA